MQHSRFVHLHLHTQYSLLDGAIRPSELMDKVHDYKMPAVAMTDHGNMFGAIEFYQKAMKKGVKPIIGSEVYVANSDRFDKSSGTRDEDGSRANAFHLVLLCKNFKGYQNLCRLVSLGYTEGFYYRPRIDKEILKEHSEGLIALGACLHGEVSYKLNHNQYDEAKKAALEFSEIFPDRRFFLEIQNNGIPEQLKVNEQMIKLSRETGLPLVATNDCHYLNAEDARFHEILLCVQTGKTMDDPNRFKFSTNEFYLKSPEQMFEIFKDVPEALENTVEIAERCNLELKFDEYHLPDYHLEKDQTLESELERITHEGMDERFKVMEKKGFNIETDKWPYLERLKKELKVIKGMGFPGYFLIVADFINYAKKESIAVGPGRGSAAGSLVAFAMGITDLDPIKYNLLFERFLNPDRLSMPDIDVDFCFEKRDEVIKYVTDKYGKDKVSQIITFGVMKAKAVIRDVGRVLGMPYIEVDKIAKLIPNTLNITLSGALKEEPRLSRMVKDDDRVAELMEAALALEGLPRHSSTHAAGVVIANKPLTDYLPLYKNQKDEAITTQFPMSDVEKIGLVKFDFLGIKTLTIIDKALKLIKENKNIEIDIDNLTLDDEKTYKLYASGLTNGVFQCESSGMQEMLRKLRPSEFEEIIAAVALYRPGPLQSGMVDDFIKRKHGLSTFQYELKELEPILDNTYGVMVYQEQVMEIAKVLASYTPGDADVLRKAMGKKIEEVMLDERKKFVEGSLKNKHPKAKVEKIFDLMAKFAGYGFNKSHSAAYALISYRTAYLKANYPVEFLAALMSSNMGDTDKIIKFIAECKDSEIEVYPPNVNESSVDFTVHGDKIKFGLAAVKNVGEAAIVSILEKRKEDGPFKGFKDFLTRVDTRKVNKKVMESLIKCGAFDFVGKSRAHLFKNLEAQMDEASSLQKDKEVGQGNIFDMMATNTGAPLSSDDDDRNSEEWEEKTLLIFEKETLGFYVSSHPLQSYAEKLDLITTDNTETVKHREQSSEVTMGGVFVEFKEHTNKTGKKMAFATLEDLHGRIEALIFPKMYEKIRDIINTDDPFIVEGRLEKEDNASVSGESKIECKIFVDNIKPIDSSEVKCLKKTHIETDVETIKDDKMDELKDIIKENPGSSSLFIHLRYPDKRVVVVSLDEEYNIDPSKATLSKIKNVFINSDITFT